MEENMIACAQQQQQQLRAILLAGNALSGRYGLTLQKQQIERLQKRRLEALHKTRRIEFGIGILPQLIEAFCDSPFINQQNYEETLCELQDSFYYFKQETMEALSDEELITYMAAQFNDICQGSLEYLNGTVLEELGRRIREGGGSV